MDIEPQETPNNKNKNKPVGGEKMFKCNGSSILIFNLYYGLIVTKTVCHWPHN